MSRKFELLLGTFFFFIIPNPSYNNNNNIYYKYIHYNIVPKLIDI